MHMQSKMDALTAKVNEAGGRAMDIEEKVMAIKEAEEERKRPNGPWGKAQEISDIIRQNNIKIIGIPEE